MGASPTARCYPRAVQPLDTFRESVLALNGHDLAWLDWGEGVGAGPPVLCLHGAGEISHVWDDFASRLAGRRRVVAPDLRGHGDSDAVDPSAYRLSDFRADVEALLAQLRIERVAVVGQGLGGVLALVLAGAAPARVERLVVVDTAARLPDAHCRALRERSQQPPAPLPDFAAMVAAARGVAPGADEETITWLLPYLFRRSAGGHVWKWDPQALAVADQWSAQPWLARIRCPVLIVRAEESTVLPAGGAEALAAEIDDCRVVTIPRAGHALILEQPAAFAEAVAPFLLEGRKPS